MKSTNTKKTTDSDAFAVTMTSVAGCYEALDRHQTKEAHGALKAAQALCGTRNYL